MQLSDLSIPTIRSSATFGVKGLAYIDGTKTDAVPDGLYKIRGVFMVDVNNAIRHDNSNAWNCLMRHAYINV